MALSSAPNQQAPAMIAADESRPLMEIPVPIVAYQGETHPPGASIAPV